MPYTKTKKDYIDTRLSLAGPTWSQPDYLGSANFLLESIRTGENSRNFHHSIKQRLNATTPMSASRETASVVRGMFRLNHNPGFESPISGSAMVGALTRTNLSVDSAMKDSAKAQAIKYFNNQILKYQRPFSSQVFLGELRETIQLLRNPLSSSMKLAAAFEKKIAKAKRSRVPSELANVWLEFRFAILPLISDTFNILELIEQVALDKDVIRITGYGESNRIDITQSYIQPVSSARFDYSLTSEHKAQCFIKSGLLISKLNAAQAGIDKLKDALLSFEALPSTMWELTPGSFLVDYFFNIGDIVSTPLSGYGALSYYSLSEVQSVRTDCKFIGCTPVSMSVFSSFELVSPTSWTYKKSQVQRVGTASAIPPLTFNLPGSPVPYVNMAALLISKLKL